MKGVKLYITIGFSRLIGDAFKFVHGPQPNARFVIANTYLVVAVDTTTITRGSIEV